MIELYEATIWRFEGFFTCDHQCWWQDHRLKALFRHFLVGLLIIQFPKKPSRENRQGSDSERQSDQIKRTSTWQEKLRDRKPPMDHQFAMMPFQLLKEYSYSFTLCVPGGNNLHRLLVQQIQTKKFLEAYISESHWKCNCASKIYFHWEKKKHF